MAHVAIIGGGVAGMGAAVALCRAGHRITLFDSNGELGGRCRTFFWHGRWRIRGAHSFIAGEANIVALSELLGIHDPAQIEDRSAEHVFSILRAGRVHKLHSLAPRHVALTSLLSVSEKLRAAAALAPLSRARTTSLDDRLAIAHFRTACPAFADYVLEPVFGLFCGYAPGDFSLAWLAWLMAQQGSGDNRWWAFREGGVGRLTTALAGWLRDQPAVMLHPGTAVSAVREQIDHVELQVAGAPFAADAVIVAVPGPLAAALIPAPDHPARAVLAKCRYSRHDVVHVQLAGARSPPLRRVVLPAAEGFGFVANLEFEPGPDDRLIVYGETKGELPPGVTATADAILAAFLKEAARFWPPLGDARLLDAHVEINDLALPCFAPGYLSSVQAWQQGAPPSRIEPAGDWLFNTSVGSALGSGERAAQRIMTRLATLAA